MRMQNKTISNVRDYIKKKAFQLGGGAIELENSPNDLNRETTFINSPDKVRELGIEENDTWYLGEEEMLLNFYTRADIKDYNEDPILFRNKKDFFWSKSSTEQDYKRTHSGQPRNIVDTISSIVGNPKIFSTDQNRNAILQDILKKNKYKRLLMRKARPYALVEGWGAWKINWDKSVSDMPILLYYRANSVDFVERNGQIFAIIYQDYYQDEDDRKYVLFETRCIKHGSLYIEKELFEYLSDSSDNIRPVPLNTIKELRDTKSRIIFEGFPYFLGEPVIYYEDLTGFNPGRSIFSGKIGLFDDLDLALSQASNAMKRSTPLEYVDSAYLPRNEKTGLPMPLHSFDRKFIMYNPVMGSDGTISKEPVTVTQPNIDFKQYSDQAIQILIQIVSGVLSPATLGVDVARDQPAQAQREKEKVTIFTRNVLIDSEKETQESLMFQLLATYDFMRFGETELLSTTKAGISIEYDGFADASYESKIETVLTAYQGGIMSDEQVVDYLYRDAPKKVRERELEFMKQQREQAQQLAGRDGDDELAELGAVLGGNENNEHNQDLQSKAPEDAEKRNGVPDLVND